MNNRPTSFEDKLLAKLRLQIKSRRVGFLLGAGASYLSGTGYPLAPELWAAIKDHMPKQDQRRIEAQQALGTHSLEQSLDALDVQPGADLELRHRISAAIADSFRSITPSLEHHRSFVARISVRPELRTPVFTLNYDSLLERAADAEEVHLIDGFQGFFEASFNPSRFTKDFGLCAARRGKRLFVPDRGLINLYKLHGSLGWFGTREGKMRRMPPDTSCQMGCRRLMVPPSNRKAADTGFTPYAMFWSEFRAYLANDTSRILNRLVSVGYGFGDGHVNEVLWSGLARQNFTLVVFAKVLSDDVFNRLAGSHKAIVVTEARSSLQRERGPGIRDAWSFEWLSREV